MKTTIHNYLSVIRRFRMATVLNITGLAVAFAAFIVILIQVNYERSFDCCHPTANKVFRAELEVTSPFATILARGYVEMVIESSPHIKGGTLINPFIAPIYFTVTKGSEKIGFREKVETCLPGLIRTFGIPLVEGDANCLDDPEKILIPQSLARKLFGDESAVGKVLHAEEFIWSKERAGNFTVGAVYKDFPGNTQLRNVIYMKIHDDSFKSNFQSSNFICYLLLDDKASAANVTDNFNANFDYKKVGWKEEQKLKLTALTDIYYLNEQHDGNNFRSGSKDTTNLLVGIGLLIILIAVINFINFSTALAPLRIKSINTQKVFGSPDSRLRRALLSEAIITSLAAFLLSLAIIYVLAYTSLLAFVDADLSLTGNTAIILFAGCIACLTGWLAGFYPSRYMVSFPPALVLKGSFGLSPKGRKLRTALIGVQFVISILLIIAAGFVNLQNNYMRSFSLGFDKDQIAIVELNGNLYQNHHETYANRLKAYSGIEDVAFAAEKVASKDGYNTNSDDYKGKSIQYFLITCSYNFLSVMGIPVADGRGFTQADTEAEQASYIFNHAARVNGDMVLGDAFGNWFKGRIVGFTDDVLFTSLRAAENNIAFIACPSSFHLHVSYIRLKAGTDVHAAVSHIRNTLADIDPSYPFDVEFYDGLFNQLYHKEVNLRSLVTLFSMLAIILSLTGIFGLVVFETQYRRKEIGIRKVHGATVSELLAMFNKTYIRIVGICFLIAAPVAYYGVRKWLENFAYKTPVYWWVFALAFLIVSAITLATVSIQNWQAARVNPVDSIKTE